MSGTATGRRSTPPAEKRGGYSSSSKPISELKPPPRGPAPGAKPSTGSGTTDRQK
jgi:hypothetical protein